ncbi:MAG: hypothetical protein WDM90_08825 [Ferruginibacter sp.]
MPDVNVLEPGIGGGEACPPVSSNTPFVPATPPQVMFGRYAYWR